MNMKSVPTEPTRSPIGRIRRLPSNWNAAGGLSPNDGCNGFKIAEYVRLLGGVNNAAEYGRNFASFVRRLIRLDTTADYYAFVLNTTLPIAKNREKNPHAFIAALRRACERTTVHLFPIFSKSHPERHDPNCSVGVIFVPSISASGAVHYHGWIRVPHAASQVLQAVAIHTDGVRHHIDAPEALAAFVKRLVEDTGAPFAPDGKCSTSLWLSHRDGLAVPTGRGFRPFDFKYLQKTADGELRQWAESDFVPALVFKSRTKSIAADRARRANRLRQERSHTQRNGDPMTERETPASPKVHLSQLIVFRASKTLAASLAAHAARQGITVSANIRALLMEATNAREAACASN